jgi:Flp pilus assembly pilin Flp
MKRRKREMMESFMTAMVSIKRFFEKKDVDGQALIEYALILVLIAVVAIAILYALGGSVSSTFTRINDTFVAAPSGS